jgi:hypothetical protein
MDAMDIGYGRIALNSVVCCLSLICGLWRDPLTMSKPVICASCVVYTVYTLAPVVPFNVVAVCIAEVVSYASY